MPTQTPVTPLASSGLGLAIVLASSTPLILLDKKLVVQAASGSFCRLFDLDPRSVAGRVLLTLGSGEWNLPQLQSLLTTTLSGSAAVEAYELDLVRGERVQHLVLHSQRLMYNGSNEPSVLLAVTDVTALRAIERQKDDLIREKQVLLQELQHRVANSLQIIASVLMLGARNVQSEEARSHLQDAHQRVMAIAKLQKQLTTAAADGVPLGAYLTDLCASIGASMIAQPDELRLTTSVDDTVSTADQSVSLGLIVTELVINALKHAFADHLAGGEIVVSFNSTANGWTLTVEDNGSGKSPTAEPGLGTSIVDALAKQLKADVTVLDAQPGTRIVVHHDGAMDDTA